MSEVQQFFAAILSLASLFAVGYAIHTYNKLRASGQAVIKSLTSIASGWTVVPLIAAAASWVIFAVALPWVEAPIVRHGHRSRAGTTVKKILENPEEVIPLAGELFKGVAPLGAQDGAAPRQEGSGSGGAEPTVVVVPAEPAEPEQGSGSEPRTETVTIVDLDCWVQSVTDLITVPKPPDFPQSLGGTKPTDYVPEKTQCVAERIEGGGIFGTKADAKWALVCSVGVGEDKESRRLDVSGYFVREVLGLTGKSPVAFEGTGDYCVETIEVETDQEQGGGESTFRPTPVPADTPTPPPAPQQGETEESEGESPRICTVYIPPSKGWAVAAREAREKCGFTGTWQELSEANGDRMLHPGNQVVNLP
jgi:hypothetical protein